MVHLFNTTSTICNAFMKNTFKRTLHHRKPNHYEVLKLSQNCSHKDIKKAYYELSKMYHPDRSNHTSPKLFLEVSEAYKTLSKPDARHRYDMSLIPYSQRYKADFYDQYTRRNRMDGPSFYRPQGTNYDYDHLHRYSTRRSDRVTKSAILAAVLIFMAVGVTLQVLTFRHAMRLRKEEFKLSSQMANRSLEQALLRADENGNNAAQVKLLEERFRANNISLD